MNSVHHPSSPMSPIAAQTASANVGDFKLAPSSQALASAKAGAASDSGYEAVSLAPSVKAPLALTTRPSRRWSVWVPRARQAVDIAGMFLGLAGGIAVLFTPYGGIVAAVGIGIHLANNTVNWLRNDGSALSNVLRRSAWVGAVSALAWSILVLTVGATNPAGWIVLGIGHVALGIALAALLWKHRRAGVWGCCSAAVKEAWRLLLPSHRPSSEQADPPGVKPSVASSVKAAAQVSPPIDALTVPAAPRRNISVPPLQPRPR